ncbi:MAG: DUF2190 family protein [Dehalococcoidia bacterium]|nr:DUF2190 family protein [Dehalococcoidia bacterium]
MARTYQQPGLILTYTNAGGTAINAGDVVVAEDIVGIATVNIAANGGVGTISIEGVHEVRKINGAAWSIGEKLDWDASAASSAGAFGVGVAQADGDVIGCAIAARAAGSSDEIGYVKLVPGAGDAGVTPHSDA